MDLRSLPVLDKLPGGPPPLPLVLELDLTAGVLTQAPGDPLSALRQRNVPSLDALLHGVREAARDDRVAAVVLLGGDELTAAQSDELGAGIDALRVAGKATYAYAPTFGELGAGTIPYALAARCEQVWLQPSGQVGLTGISLGLTLVRGALDKLGVEPQFGKRHEYKTAADLFAAHEVSDASREMAGRLAASVMEQLTGRIAEHRDLDAGAVADLVARAPLSAQEARDGGLVDHLGFRDQLDAALEAAHGEHELLYVHRYAKTRPQRSPVEQVRRRGARQVAIVPVHGGIVDGRGRPGGPGPAGGPRAGAATVVRALRSAGESDRVAAVVLHIDSPGGSYIASDAIRHAVLQLRATGRPVVASMGTVAASGGYFAAMPTDRVFALPTTITGSIGVLAGKFVVAGLTERLGVVRELVGAGANATMFAPDVPFTDEQRARLEAWLDEVYEDFTRKAAQDRDMPWEQLEPLARGRVWTGADALERGLVDELGGRGAAVAWACERAGLRRDDVDVVGWPQIPFVERLKPAESSRAAAAAVGLGTPSLASPDAWLAALADVAGAPTGVLSLPGDWRLR